MLDWIVKYWLEVLFTVVCSGGAYLFHRYIKLVGNEKEAHEKQMLATIDEKFKE